MGFDGLRRRNFARRDAPGKLMRFDRAKIRRAH
jgi:hypothetical protein